MQSRRFGPRGPISWPHRPHPQPDELLSSYLFRTAGGLGMKPITFLNAIWGSQRSLLGYDIDNRAPDGVINRIVENAGIDRAAIVATTLADLKERLNASLIAKARKPWILPITILANDRYRPGLQFCPMCLRTDDKPYLRRTWRLAFATCCTTHGVKLRDRCPHCQAPLHPHRALSLRHCYRCGGDLAHQPVAAPPSLLEQQREFETALATGWATLAGQPLYAQLYFCVVRQISALLVNGRRTQALRDAVASRFGGDGAEFPKPTERQPIEYLDVDDRARLFDLVRRIMIDFPSRFVEACIAVRIGRSYIDKDMPYVPFVFADIINTQLDQTPYYPTDAEVAAAAAWLRARHGRATYRDLKALCGESRMAIYRHMDYERRQTKPSWRRVVTVAERRVFG
jgi:hypothetical protein